MEHKQKRSSENTTSIRAVVGKVRDSGANRFVVTYLSPETQHPQIVSGESITFSLTRWLGNAEPQKGQVVELQGVERFVNGWRASSACPVTLQPQATRKE